MKNSLNKKAPKPLPPAGRIFAIGIGFLCLMVAVGLGIIFLKAKQQAANRDRHPTIGQPVETP